ncbi:insulinase family protein [Streptomyces sp. UNOC14_S4]|uniref:insulinase family protein n=1 Tax=Streptomyces sp. UNOC14_S4 TaxID=2872340 RepID=UPI001E58CFE7|nr:insulinase family protein [Streptomyces sp. UNOC14_S4]MCC3770095.1 insulinase family protein [Streptomyces sp. UNOC14_S4]
MTDPLYAFPAAVRGPLAAACLAVPLAGVSRPAVLAAPLAAEGWARAVAAAARSDGVDCRVEPVVTADLAGVAAEVVAADRTALRALPEWFRRARQAQEPGEADRLRAACLARLSSREQRSDDVRRVLFGDRHRYGIGHRERVRSVRGAGDRELSAAAAELLAERPVTPAQDGTPVVAARFPGGERRTVRIAGEDAYCLLGTPGVPLGSAWKFPLHVAWALLGGREGLLDRRLRRERGLTYALAAFSRELAEGGYGMCFAGCRPEALDEVAGCVAETLDGLGRAPVGEGLLRAAKERLIVQWHRAVQAERRRAERIVGYAAAGLGPADFAAYPAGVAAVTAEDVRAAAGAFLRPDASLEIRTVAAAGR